MEFSACFGPLLRWLKSTCRCPAQAKGWGSSARAGLVDVAVDVQAQRPRQRFRLLLRLFLARYKKDPGPADHVARVISLRNCRHQPFAAVFDLHTARQLCLLNPCFAERRSDRLSVSDIERKPAMKQGADQYRCREDKTGNPELGELRERRRRSAVMRANFALAGAT